MLQRLGNGVKTRGSAVAGRIMLVGEIPVFWGIGDPFLHSNFMIPNIFTLLKQICNPDRPEFCLNRTLSAHRFDATIMATKASHTHTPPFVQPLWSYSGNDIR